MENFFWIGIVGALVALLFAYSQARKVKQYSEGTPTMQKIAAAIRKGANAYLKRQYKTVGVIFAIIAVVLAVLAYVPWINGQGLVSKFVPFAFITGGFYSCLAGFIGMRIATSSNARTANAASESLNRGLRVAISSGSVMGFTVVGLGILDVSVWFLILKYGFGCDSTIIANTMVMFGMGASCAALFARVGGGIFTKAADVGADLVGKVEAGIPEDDPRNPRFDVRYACVPDAELPRTESLEQTIARILPYWHCVVFPSLMRYDSLLVVAHGNSLRGVIKHLKGIPDDRIAALNLPTAVPYVFEFDDALRLVRDYYLGDPEEIRRRAEAVARQGSAR